MKTTIHPELVRSTAVCASCGATYELRSTRRELRLDVCSACHPAYTGVRAQPGGNRIERFERRRALAGRRERIRKD